MNNYEDEHCEEHADDEEYEYIQIRIHNNIYGECDYFICNICAMKNFTIMKKKETK